MSRFGFTSTHIPLISLQDDEDQQNHYVVVKHRPHVIGLITMGDNDLL